MLKAMTKLSKPLEFTYKFSRKVVRDLKLVSESIELRVVGSAYLDKRFSKLDVYNRYGADIDFIYWEGKEVSTLLDYTVGLEAIEEEAILQAAKLFEATEEGVAA
jgi:hypothetical protein